MGQAIPTQHPAVVLRSHYTHVRIMLAIAMIAVVGLTVAVVILAGDDGAGTSATSAAASRSDAAGTESRAPYHDGFWVPSASAPLPSGRRYDGGPDEGTRGVVATRPSNTRADGGPEEGTRGPGR